MANDRSSGFLGGSSFVRVNSTDSVSGIPDKKRSKNQQTRQDQENDDNNANNDLNGSEFVDRSAQLNATLNSLAMINVANVIKNKGHLKTFNVSSKEDLVDDNH